MGVANDSDSRRFRFGLFHVTLGICAAVATIGIAFPESLTRGVEVITETTFGAIDWFFMMATTGALLLCVGLALSRFGSVRLGKPDDRPEFSTMSWLSMLFAAGMGTGLLFWSVAEPLTHFTGAPGLEANTPSGAHHALVLTGLHWGLHAWGIYALAALVISYFAFRRDTPYLPGSPLRDSFRAPWASRVANAADFIAVLAVAFGVAGSMAMGVFQLETGISMVAGTPAQSTGIQMGILVVLIVCYMASASTGLDKGIKWLSNINMAIAIALMLFVLIAGPTSFLLRAFFNFLGDYLTNLPRLAFNLYPYENSRGWLAGWTLIYFIWWIAWAPFVGVFIARISRGRTVREFVVGVLLVPTLFSILWFAIFGGSGLYQELHGAGGLTELVREDITLVLFGLFERLPLSMVLSAMSLVLVFIFLVTSVDSATFVLGMLTSRGSFNPPASRKLGWGLALGALGGALMLSRNIDVVRAMAILGAIPFTFILLFQAVALLRALRRDHPDKRDEGEH